MIQLTDDLWVGDSHDEEHGDLATPEIDAVLNVANDLQGTRKLSEGIEYAQVGLLDGPGNEASYYCAAMLCLRMLLRRSYSVLVYDHDGCRALVVALMYLNLEGGTIRQKSTDWSHWPTWAERYAIERKLNKLIGDIKTVKQAHIDAFNKIPWSLIEVV